jgi:hypothetical protein
MGHGVRQRPLQELLVGDARRERRVREVVAQRLQLLVEAGNLLLQTGQRRRRVVAAAQHGARVADQPGHVPEQLVRRAHVGPRAELAEAGGRAAQRFLGAVRQCGQEVLQQTA